MVFQLKSGNKTANDRSFKQPRDWVLVLPGLERIKIEHLLLANFYDEYIAIGTYYDRTPCGLKVLKSNTLDEVKIKTPPA